MALNKEQILSDLKLWYFIPQEDTSQDELLKMFIQVAIDKAVALRYPFDLEKTQEDLEPRFSSWIFRASRSIYDSQGAYNIKSFSQNGLSITYENMQDGISTSLINEIMPKVGVPK